MARPGIRAPHAVALLALLSPFTLAHRANTQSPHPTTAPGTKTPPARSEYAGDASCATCHAKESETYATTAHHLTSRPASADSIHGSFHDGANTLKTANPALTFRMTADPDGFHQTAVDQIAPGKEVTLTQPIDIVVGSGTKSQTYLYWKSDQLFELPVSFWVKTGAWINSPGYVDGSMRFDRPIYPRCLECHGSSFTSLAPPANRFDKSTLVLGIECERCHGPARAHVAFYTAHPGEKSSSRPEALRAAAEKSASAPAQPPGQTTPTTTPAHAIINPARLSRARDIDTCAICHAGLGQPLAPALSFTPGAALEQFLHIPATDPTLPVDVHGNQVELLEASRCFQKSAMTCNTCHNVHQPQHDLAAFSQTCLQCHKPQQCGEFHTEGEAILTRCVDCHMPLKKSVALFSNSNDQTLQLPVREHRIAIYKDLH